VLPPYVAVGEDNIVRVEFIYEPDQQGSANSLELQRHTPQEAQVGSCKVNLHLFVYWFINLILILM
jgi:hypothetical protein